MFDEELTERVCSTALAGGFAVCAAVERSLLESVPPEADPERMLPGYRSVLVIGAAADQVISSGPYGPALLQPAPALTLSRIKADLETAGHSVRPIAEGGVSLPRMAEAAGLGDLSPVDTLVVSGYGPALTLFGFVTDAPLGRLGLNSEAHEHCDGCSLCIVDCPAMLPGVFDRDWCTGCGACVSACPQVR